MPDGTIYRADDPRLLGWVHASEIDSFLTAHQKYGGTRLSPHECDRYVGRYEHYRQRAWRGQRPTIACRTGSRA